MELEFIRITSSKDKYFKECETIYHTSFPLNERRSQEEQERVFREYSNFFFYAIVNGNQVVGLISFWLFSDVLFGEHLAIDHQLRSAGIGGEAIAFIKEKMEQCGRPIVLEIEPPCNEITCRREQFYLRHNFIRNSIKHCQPPFHKNMEPLELIIMSYPELITPQKYSTFIKEYSEIMPKF